MCKIQTNKTLRSEMEMKPDEGMKIQIGDSSKKISKGKMSVF